MSVIVQFTHPGGEHKPDRNDHTLKSWNTGVHRRKFLKANGKYVKDNSLKEGELLFWGEWEPPSKVLKLDARGSKFLPNWLHAPFLPNVLPNSLGYQKSFQNTDPLVFGECFRYFVCKQFSAKRKKETFLSGLEKGDIILFGSTVNQNTENAFFQLDTVFVISDYFEYDPSIPNALDNYNVDNYKNIVYKMAFPNPLDYSLKLRLYFGATFIKPVNGMYSFSPAKICIGNDFGFPRIKLNNIPYITNNLNAAPKKTFVCEEDALKFWVEIRDLSRLANCVEGVQFTLS